MREYDLFCFFPTFVQGMQAMKPPEGFESSQTQQHMNLFKEVAVGRGTLDNSVVLKSNTQNGFQWLWFAFAFPDRA